ncbi:hypothetical protein HII17_00945 [Thalassotalea sp. M1531]|uniref:Globin domain-containing protein n=1 Tax=Thalassotalea algicola TaxID=2716224 RepID=A0A7Y0L8V7_9GAMM|nr:globin domain-containing protein [Thalassotalea algicola]NMP30114.1 hypothetical protein [Thalassotalea algicola]
MTTNRELVFDSYKRINEAGSAFYDHFHENFVNADEKIAKIMENVDVGKQQQLLSQSLTHAVLFTQPDAKIPEHLQKLVNRHEKMNLDESYYQTWRLTLLCSIEAFDPDFNEVLKQAWNEALLRLTDIFIKSE